jgi:hypothetical protein
MNNTKTININNIKLSSTVFPTAEDMALWQSLSEEERLAIIERDEQEAYQSGIAPHVSKDELIARVRTEKVK